MITGEPVIPALVCQNESLTFDGTASFGADGAAIVEYNWDFADGTTGTGATVQHAFPEAGAYDVILTVVDDNECVNINSVLLSVWVSTTPDFSQITAGVPTEICEGESFDLNGEAGTSAVTWSELPETDLGDGVPLPDGSGVSYTSELTFTQFDPGHTVDGPGDLLSVCAELEHSYMGDLVISLTCPNGQILTMHQQGGNNTYLGAANDADAGNNPVLGACWNYCWSATATEGTWVDEVNAGNTTIAGTPPSAALNPGTYSPVQPWSNLYGCPLNGTWTFTVSDMWAIDNGFICSWGLEFDPSLFPDLVDFTPDIGFSMDSCSWTGSGWVPDPGNPSAGTATPVGVGDHPYTFSVTDNFGCTYDTTIYVMVNPGIQGPILIEGDTVICGGEQAQINAPAGYDTYEWSHGPTGAEVSVEPGTYTVVVALGDCTLESEPITVVAAEDPVPVITGPSTSCGGLPVTLTTTEPFAAYNWSNGDLTATTTVETGVYTVTVTTEEGCEGTSSAFPVVVGNTPTAGFFTDPFSPQPPGTTVMFTDTSNGNGSVITEWEWWIGGNDSTLSGPNVEYTLHSPGSHTITLVVTTSEGCMDTVQVQFVIQPGDVIPYNVFSPNGDGSNDFFVFDNVQYYNNHLAVYNRWGQLVYETNNYRNNWRATDVPEGTYFYVLKLPDEDREYTGHVTILR